MRSDHLVLDLTVAQARAALALLEAGAFDDRDVWRRAFPHSSAGHRRRLAACADRVGAAIEAAFERRLRRARPHPITEEVPHA